jgi:hypothetical protein
MRGKQAKRLRHLVKMEVGRKMVAEKVDTDDVEVMWKAHNLYRQMYRRSKRVFARLSKPKSLLYVDLSRHGRERLQARHAISPTPSNT